VARVHKTPHHERSRTSPRRGQLHQSAEMRLGKLTRRTTKFLRHVSRLEPAFASVGPESG